jgi:O-antigen biosynthesis protein WbqP
MMQHRQEALELNGMNATSARVPRRKRMLDLLIAVPALAAALPFLAIAALLIRATSTGPVIFAQTRVGKNGRPFRCYKLRTMFTGIPSVPTHEAPVSAITPIGHVMRNSKMDELPQLWNVIRGDMSLVGPRPCLPEQDQLLFHRTQLGVLELTPGITGLAQIRGIDMSDPLRCARADAEYLGSWSLRQDLSILAHTILPRS